MADTSLLTRCPHCNTRFRVGEDQLSVAKGKVRCGHCMEVFNAREHQLSDAGQTSAGTAPDVDDEPDLLFEDNPEEDAAEGAYAGGPASFSVDELSDSFLNFDDSQPASDEDETETAIDESWAEAMLMEFEKDPDLSAGPEDRITPSGHNEAAPEAPASEPENEPARPVTESPARTSGTAHSSDTPEPEPDTWTLAGEEEEPALTGTGQEESFPAEETAPASDRRPETSRQPLSGSPYDQLSREPVSVSGRTGRTRGWLWSLMILILAGGLISQVAWYQFDRLSAIPELRPWYERACALAGCELQPLLALERIQSRQLVVRTDPENREALLVDAVIINQAEFEQPFPAIALTFSNLNGDVVAQSVFPPDDYLAGEGQTLRTMPPGTPVRIAISIRDPGRDAVNYNLRFVPARNPEQTQAAR